MSDGTVQSSANGGAAAQQALPSALAAPGMLVHPAADRRLAAEHWLLSTLPEARRARARREWRDQGVAMLPLGTLFSAIRIPAELAIAATGARRSHTHANRHLADTLDGPVICDPRGHRYYALDPASTPRTWHKEADDWRVADVDVLGRGTLLGVPPLDRTEFDPVTAASYWAVPMESMAVLCRPLTVGRLIAAGRDQLTEELGA